MITKYLSPRNDTTFKRIFGKDDNKEILIAMFNAVLKNQLDRFIKYVAFFPVDILCKDKDGCQHIIEMQIAHSKGFEKERNITFPVVLFHK